MSYQIRAWLVLCALLVLSMVILGGYTRLSNAGLSIVEWQPVTGIFYPNNDARWQQEFALYQNSPEFICKNFSFSLEEFKHIYFIEYAHRLLGRLLGAFFLLGFCYFLSIKALTPKLTKRLLFVFVLGAAQSVVGWYMVKSGLAKLPEVSQYRLALHLLMAITIYGLLVWQIFPKPASQTGSKMQLLSAKILLIVTIIQISSGALVAGLDGGLVYNSFPLMDGKFIPNGLIVMQPWYKNFGENIETVQFAHRILGITLTVFVVLFSGIMAIYSKSPILAKTALSLFCVVCLQFVLGVLTLLYAAPILLALMHQLGAIILFTNLLFVINLLTCKTHIK